MKNSGKVAKYNAWFGQTLYSSSHTGNRALLHIVIVCVSLRNSSFCRFLLIPSQKTPWWSERHTPSHAPNYGPLLCFFKFAWFPSFLCGTFNGSGKCVLNDEWISCVRNCCSLSDLFEEKVFLTSLVWARFNCRGSRISRVWRDEKCVKRNSNYSYWSDYYSLWIVCLWSCLRRWWNDF